jgi:phytoene dehydrogenase-like protein
MELVGARYFDTGFVRRIHNLRMRGNAARLHLALDGLPAFTGLEEQDHGQRLLIAPDMDYVERAFNPAKYGEWSARPVMEISIPSVSDASLAPAGGHVLSATVQYAPYHLKGGWNDATTAEFYDLAIERIARYAPGIRSQVVHADLVTPAMLESRYRVHGGHWHHGELALDQFLFVRPVVGAAQYALPLKGLYLCGAGAHPGGGISGAAGRNAALTVLDEEPAA